MMYNFLTKMETYMKSKYIVAFLLILALCLGLSACGRKAAKPSAEPGTQTEAGAKPGESAPESSAPSGETPEPPHEPTPQEIAASMQDYTIGENGKAAPIGVVDDNYLILVNKTHPLSKDYWPDDMVTVSKTVAGVGNADTHKLRKVAADALEEMFAAAAKDGVDIALRTGFRSYSYQDSLFKSYVANHGEAEANTFSARPGESEHQSGLCCDLGGKSEGYALSYSFGGTAEGKWVAEHAHEYGFIIRYIDGKTVNGQMQPGEITGYVFEPWHIRYVGADVAAEIVEKGITFEEYLGVLD